MARIEATNRINGFTSFNMSTSLSVPVNTPVYPVAQALVQTLKDDDDLSLSPGSGDMFPDRNGSFVLRGETYTYRENLRHSNSRGERTAANCF